MKRRILLLLALALAAGLLCCGAAVAETTTEIFDIKSGSCGENVTYQCQRITTDDENL